jgi:hypothetical protein
MVTNTQVHHQDWSSIKGNIKKKTGPEPQKTTLFSYFLPSICKKRESKQINQEMGKISLKPSSTVNIRLILGYDDIIDISINSWSNCLMFGGN